MITSTSNSKVKELAKCIKNAKERKRQDVFIVEGLRMFSEIPRKLHVESFVTESFYEKNRELFSDIRYELVADHIMESVSDTKTPQGIVSVVRRLHYTPEEVCKAGCAEWKPFLAALENIQDPGNLGTILRTAEAAGVTGILMSRDTVDIYNPKVVRSTMGSIFRMPFSYVENLTGWIEELAGKGYGTFGAHLQGASFYDFDYRNPTIFCIGNEGNGLTRELSEITSHKIKIPMMGKAESLNAAAASAILMYEAMRQRNS